MTAWQQAQQLGISGWVSNLPDGRVELIIEGNTIAVDEFLRWAQQGSPFAQISHIELTEQEATAEFNEFEIR